MRRLAITLVAISSAAGLAACGGGGSNNAGNAAKKALEQAGIKTNNKGGGSIQFTDQNGKGSVSAGDGTTLPSDFPRADVPLPNGGTLSSVSSFAGPSGKTWTVIVKVSGDANQAATAYQHALQNAGYSINDTVNLGALISAYTAVGSKYDVKVAGSGASGTNDPAGLIVTVAPHDPNNTPSTSSPNTSASSTP